LNVDRELLRAKDIKQAILNIRNVLSGISYEQMRNDILIRAGFERFVEIISEASRKVPPEWRETYGHDIAWHKILAIGNILRHVYRDVDHMILREIYADHLDPLEAAIDAMIEAHGPIPRPPLPSP
jgi:uncharacterized protein with HEPN domain